VLWNTAGHSCKLVMVQYCRNCGNCKTKECSSAQQCCATVLWVLSKRGSISKILRPCYQTKKRVKLKGTRKKEKRSYNSIVSCGFIV
jgi:hypothetical protein